MGSVCDSKKKRLQEFASGIPLWRSGGSGTGLLGKWWCKRNNEWMVVQQTGGLLGNARCQVSVRSGRVPESAALACARAGDGTREANCEEKRSWLRGKSRTAMTSGARGEGDPWVCRLAQRSWGHGETRVMLALSGGPCIRDWRCVTKASDGTVPGSGGGGVLLDGGQSCGVARVVVVAD